MCITVYELAYYPYVSLFCLDFCLERPTLLQIPFHALFKKATFTWESSGKKQQIMRVTRVGDFCIDNAFWAQHGNCIHEITVAVITCMVQHKIEPLKPAWQHSGWRIMRFHPRWGALGNQWQLGQGREKFSSGMPFLLDYTSTLIHILMILNGLRELRRTHEVKR